MSGGSHTPSRGQHKSQLRNPETQISGKKPWSCRLAIHRVGTSHFSPQAKERLASCCY